MERPRVLGDAWADWDPAQGTGEARLPGGPALYVGVNGLFGLLLVAAWSVIVWLAAPRLSQAGLAGAGRWALWGAGALAILIPSLFIAAFAGGLRLGAGPARLLQRWAFATWEPTAALGGLCGASRDRMGHAFLHLANRLARAAGLPRRGKGLLVLAPRCLRADIMRELRRIAGEAGARLAVVAGGEEARAAILRDPPAGVLAIACERDLVAGVREVAGRYLVLSLPNRRPEGPCRNSEIDLEEASRMLAHLGRLSG
ncbi:MAG: DUF116 domain-containing protein [Candidatus Eisenbacteria bacterium]